MPTTPQGLEPCTLDGTPCPHLHITSYPLTPIDGVERVMHVINGSNNAWLDHLGAIKRVERETTATENTST